MALAQTYPNYSLYPHNEETLTINFDSLLLAIFTSFNIEVTDSELLLNVRNLLVDLNLAVPDNISKDVQDSLPSLVSNQYLEHNEDKYQLSNKGKLLGLKALKNFQDSVPKFFNN
ncbi:MAG: hypothetical protein ACTSSO_01530 [Candidatus Hodarchaeales archaeon]